MESTYSEHEFQDELDAGMIYTILENEVVPAFYQRNAEDVPEKWVGFIKKSVSQVASNFTTLRMITDYQNRFYSKLYQRSSELIDDDYDIAKKNCCLEA